MKKWVCSVCGYVYEGENPPEKCPQCGVPASKFTEQKGDRERAEVSMTSILSLLMKLLSLRAVATGTTVAFGRDYFSMIGVLRMMPFKLHGSIFIKS